MPFLNDLHPGPPSIVIFRTYSCRTKNTAKSMAKSDFARAEESSPLDLCGGSVDYNISNLHRRRVQISRTRTSFHVFINPWALHFVRLPL